MSKYKILLFDADDTLWDFQLSQKTALQLMFRHFQIPFIDQYLIAYKKISEKLWKDLEDKKIDSIQLRTDRFKILAEEFQLNYPVKEGSEIYIEYLSGQNHPYPGAENLLNYLHNKYNCYIVTNGLKEVQRKRFERSILKRFIRNIFISEEIGFSKPDPKYFEYIVKSVKSDNKNEMLVIGDSLNSDIRGGIESGIDTCWFNHGNKTCDEYKPTYIITSLERIIPILENNK